MGKTKRVIKIDFLRGLAILLVVFGHQLQTYIPLFDNDHIFRFIYSFHMPLFMFISGLVSYGHDINIKKKAFQLVIPFVVWYHIAYAYHVLMGGYPENYLNYVMKLVISPDYGYWYLWVLFLSFLSLKFVQRYANKDLIYGEVVTAILVYLVLQSSPTTIFGIGSLRWFFLFFTLGYFTSKYNKYLIKFLHRKMWIKGLLFSLFLILSSTWYRLHPPTFWHYISELMTFLSIGGNQIVFQLYNILVATIGIVTIYLVVPESGGKIYNFISYLGKNTMEIYVVHFYVHVTWGSGYASALIGTFTAVGISLIVAEILHKSNLLAAILFGKQSKDYYAK